MEFVFKPIGLVTSCFKEKFGIPRQPGIVTRARARLEIFPPHDNDEAFKGLEKFSHVWVVFVFHEMIGKACHSTVRPPRLGGNKRIGVFATRSGFRPNPLGISAVKLEKIVREKGKLFLEISGADLLDKTPVLDIKPYLPYADSIGDAKAGFAHEAPATGNFEVEFNTQALEYAKMREENDIPGFREFISQMLDNDPRPAYYSSSSSKKEDRTFGIKVFDVDIRWQVKENKIKIINIQGA